jgi:MSHA biogenesis protein MshJ
MGRFLSFFNRLGRRERMGAIFITALIVYLLMDVTLVGRAEKRHKTLRADLAKVESDLTAVRGEITVVKAELEKDPFAKDRAQLDHYKRVIDEATNFIATVDTDPRQISSLLRQLITGTPGVTLVSIRTLTPVPVTEAGKPPPGALRQQGQAAPGGALYRRGIELTIRGNYLALLPYLEKVQNLPQKVLWAEAELDVAVYPESTLKLTIYSLSKQADARLG